MRTLEVAVARPAARAGAAERGVRSSRAWARLSRGAYHVRASVWWVRWRLRWSVGASRRLAGRVAGRVAPRLRTRELARAAAWVAFAGLVSVQVLGVGRPSQVSAAPGPAAASQAELAVLDVGLSAAAPAPAPEPAPEPEPGSIAPAGRPTPPVSLRIPAIGVDAQVVDVGLEPDGAMEIPEDVRTVGWYDPFPGAGVLPGEAGTAVIAGHVDSRRQGRGAFWPLRDLRAGDSIEVVHAGGEVTRWRIVEVVRLPKEDVPIAEIFTFDGPRRLALITCGGEFDRSSGSYLENYVVTAVPVLPAALGSGPLQQPTP